MTEKKIKVLGKEVGIAYCYATEITYKERIGDDVENFISPMFSNIDGDGFFIPDRKKSVTLVWASILSYAQARKETPNIEEDALLFEIKPKELYSILTDVIALHNEWYMVPAEEADNKKSSDDQPKNA